MGQVSGRAVSALAAAGGELLALASYVATRARRAPKPLHPTGRVGTGVLTRWGADGHPTGVPWLDGAGEQVVRVRLSRSLGLPEGWPDILGLSVRIPAGSSYGDLLLATTGLGRVSRFVLTAGRSTEHRTFTTLMPYRGPRGPLLLGAVPADDDLDLVWATPTSGWTRFGRLEITDLGPDADLSFDPFLHPLPGLAGYEWARRLREPAYRSARHASGRAVTRARAPR